MNITWGQLGERLITAAASKRIPLLGGFEITARCNLRCKMCYVYRPVNDKEALEQEPSAKEWVQLAKDARDAGMLYLLLTGGEVFLREDFREIYEEISKLGLVITINTNATMITPEIARWLGLIPPSVISVTLYGASSETYEIICGDASGYERALRGIDLLLAENIKIQIKTTILNKNVNDFNKLNEFAIKCGTHIGIVNYISPRREGYHTIPIAERLSPEELAKFLIKVQNHISEKDLDDSGNKVYLERYKKYEEHPFQCSSGKCDFMVTWDGKMVPCALLGDPSINIFEKTFVDGWKQLQLLCDKVPVCVECKECLHKNICMSCPAKLKNETGCFDKPAPYLCELVEKKIDYQLDKD